MINCKSIQLFLYRHIIATCVALLLIGTSCSFGLDEPANAAQEWFVAVNTSEALEADGLTCRAKRDEFRAGMEMGSTLILLGEMVLGSDEIEIDISGVEFTTVEEESNQAIVTATGEIRGAVAGSVRSRQVDERWIMVMEEGEWRWCGEAGTTRFPQDQGQASDSEEPACSGRGLILDMASNGDIMQIYTLCPDGTELTQLTFSGSNCEPWWSPDGRKIYFISWRDGNREIYVMNVDGSNQVNLSKSTGWEGGIALSPDGRRVAFTSDRGGNFDSWVMNADGTGKINLTAQHISEETGPAWSPDGTKLVFASTRDGNSEIYIMDADGNNQVRLTNRPLMDYGPSWSLDGETIFFNSLDDDRQNHRLWNIAVSGDNLEEISSYRGIFSPTIGREPEKTLSPNGQFRVYSRRMGEISQLFVSRIDGTQEIRITNDELSWQVPSWQPLP